MRKDCAPCSCKTCDLHNALGILSVIQRVRIKVEKRVKTEQTDLDKTFDAFLDVQRVGLESHGELSRNFVH